MNPPDSSPPSGPVPGPKAARLPREAHVRTRDAFARVHRDGVRWTGKVLMLRVVEASQDDGGSQIGLAVSAAYGPAVIRNKFRRRCREAFRVARGAFPQPVLAVFTPKERAPKQPQKPAKKPANRDAPRAPTVPVWIPPSLDAIRQDLVAFTSWLRGRRLSRR
jgi:ribonuclease P protein component